MVGTRGRGLELGASSWGVQEGKGSVDSNMGGVVLGIEYVMVRMQLGVVR
jgi:hypothetical protein